MNFPFPPLLPRPACKQGGGGDRTLLHPRAFPGDLEFLGFRAIEVRYGDGVFARLQRDEAALRRRRVRPVVADYEYRVRGGATSVRP